MLETSEGKIFIMFTMMDSCIFLTHVRCFTKSIDESCYPTCAMNYRVNYNTKYRTCFYGFFYK